MTRLYVMPEVVADDLEEATSTNKRADLDPVLIRGGPYTGRYVLPLDVRYDPQFHTIDFDVLDIIDVNVAEAFPPDPNL